MSVYDDLKASLEEAIEKEESYYGSADVWLREEAKQTIRDEQQRVLEEYARKLEAMSEQERKAYLLGDWNTEENKNNIK